MSENKTVLIYAGASGVGTAAIQICKVLKAKPIALCSNSQKINICN